MDYCSVVWNHCGVMLRDHVERIQKYALRITHGKPPRTSSEPLQRALGWTTLERRWYKALVCLVDRCLADEAPSFLFRPNTDLGYIRTRGANKLHLPRPNRILPIYLHIPRSTSLQPATRNHKKAKINQKIQSSSTRSLN